MWAWFTLFLMLWGISISFYWPVVMTFAFFGAMVYCASAALMQGPGERRRLRVEEL